MCLAGARRSQEHHVLGFVEEVELREVRDERSLDRSLVREVEVEEGLYLREARGFHPGRPAMGLSRGDLLGKHRGEVSLVVPAFGSRLLGERAEGLPDARGFERPGVEGDLRGGGAHALTSARAS